MEPQSRPSLDEFQAALTGEEVRNLRILHVAMGLGVLGFATLVLGLYATRPAEGTGGDPGLLRTMTFAAFGLFAICVPLAASIHGRMLRRDPSPDPASAGPGPSLPGARWIRLIRAASLARLAVLDVPAFLGLIVCLLGVQTGALREHPIYWINLIPTAAVLLFVVQSFPSRERIERVFQEQILHRAS